MSRHMDALQRANVVRFALARVKAELAALDRSAGAERAAGMLRDPDELVGAMRMEDLLLAVHRCGPLAAGSILAQARIPHGARLRRIREFTPRQRNLIAALLEPWGRRPVAPRRTA